ncbi:YbaN family protein [Aurantiacibacter gangjinensis]|uniref:Inner membrane protein ybaN n=1 Tax=Aurantiacibacter gangjinensis TaxID=502682 RepID=A0A0G9MS57_9SPHN|nr:YbaN family protein [Aurantiacibacter gangjinensis]APE26939.1 hypothetical protein BMF35_a0110 [Aurantiacibacter gangjinensis]KLE33394.1 Inner membrane protein ybaN [Aurantiacibacter gangjinensis]
MARPLWLAAGLFFMALGWLGMILPGLPGFVFLIVAAWCFGKGSPRWQAWLLSHPAYGPPLRDWRDHRRISRRAKISAIAFMALAGALTTWLIGFPFALVTILVLLAVALWIWTRAE